jgi:hypothetical protein
MEKRMTLSKRVAAALCHHCPLCRYGRKSPQSLVGRILHHRLHAEHCPFWKAERDAYGNFTEVNQ